MYASGLFNVVEPHLPEAHAFADDSQLCVSFQPTENTNETAAITAMQNSIDDVKKWMLTNKLKLEDTRQQLAKMNASTLRVGETSVTCSSVLKTLGCWLDSQFKFETHITKVCNAVFFRIYNIRGIRKFLNEDDTRTLVNAFVTNRIDYCDSLLYGSITRYSP